MKIRLLEEPIAHLTSLFASSESRLIIGMAGLPGSGKSTLAAQLVEMVNALTSPDTAIALGMDGFHLAKAQLDRFPNPAQAHARRGAPWTFDTAGFLRRLRMLREQGENQIVKWPDFQHDIGDPVEDAHQILPATRLIIVEGLYLLHDVDGWDAVSQFFDERWYLDTEWNVAMSRLAQRHMKAWGFTLEQAEERIATNDGLNAKLVLERAEFADWRVVSN